MKQLVLVLELKNFFLHYKFQLFLGCHATLYVWYKVLLILLFRKKTFFILLHHEKLECVS